MLYYEKKISLRVSDFDRFDRLTPQAALDIFQLVATEHAEKLGIGYGAMLAKNLFWVLVRCRYDLIKNPAYCSDVIVKTWPMKEGRIDFDRDVPHSNHPNQLSHENDETIYNTRSESGGFPGRARFCRFGRIETVPLQ